MSMKDLSELPWRKSRRSDAGNGCVETVTVDDTSVAPHKAYADKLYLLRDSKDPDGPVLAFDPAEWEAFRLGMQDGEFDDM